MSETETPTMITINLVHIWVFAKVVTAFVLSRWESQKLPGRPIHQLVRRFVFHTLLNPELGLIKMIAFGPVWLATGTKHLSKFLPIQTEDFVPHARAQTIKRQSKCSVCNDTGTVFDGNSQVQCSCQNVGYWRGIMADYK